MARSRFPISPEEKDRRGERMVELLNRIAPVVDLEQNPPRRGLISLQEAHDFIKETTFPSERGHLPSGKNFERWIRNAQLPTRK